MLIEIQCDKFIKHGEIRKPIQFHAGLNTVIGDDNGSNSVGKSTFLMILDFVFGGKDYVNKCLDVQENVGEHTINFTFEFDGQSYHFSRSNVDYKHVFRCDENYEPLPEDSHLVAEYAETRDRVIRDQLFAIETMLNQKMREISVQLLKDEQHMPPVLRMEKLNKYTFNTPNDGGTGAQYRGVITFDLANMELSPLPFIIHDMQMLLHIEKRVMAEIIKAYDAQKNAGKQVFIAFDRLDTYDAETKDTMNTNCVLELSPGGNELFGRAWNKETESEKDGE